MGLLSFIAPEDEGQRQRNIAFFQQLAQAGAPQATPNSWALGIANGFGEGNKAQIAYQRFAGAQDLQKQEIDMGKLKLDAFKQEQDRKEKLRQLLAGTANPASAPNPYTAANANSTMIGAAMNGGDALSPESFAATADANAKLPAPQADNQSSPAWQRYMKIGDMLSNQGFADEAKTYYELADKWKPKYKAENYVGRGKDGALAQYMTSDDGTVIASPYSPAEKVSWKETMGTNGPVMTPLGDYGGVGQSGPSSVQSLPEGFQYGADGKPVALNDYWNKKVQVARAGKTDIALTVPINTEKTYWGNVADGMAKEFVDQRGVAQKAVDQINTSKRVLALIDQNPITGAGANWRLPIEKGLAQIGMVNGNRVATTEQLAGQLAKSTLDGIKSSGLGSGQGFTDGDREFLEKAVSGNITLEPQTLKYLANLNDQVARASIAKYQKSAAMLNGNRNQQVLPVDLNIEAPAPYSSAQNVTKAGQQKPFGPSLTYIDGKPYQVVSKNPDGSIQIKDPKTGKTGTYRE